MRYYPALIDLTGKKCMVVGGGAIAWQKAKSLLGCGAKVWVVAPQISGRLAKSRKVRRIRRQFKPGDLKDVFLVVAATDDQRVNRQVFEKAKKLNRLVNVVDQPALCSFIVPSVMRQGDLKVAISTSGVSPALSRWIRLDLTKRYSRMGRVLTRMKHWRKVVHRQTSVPSLRKRKLERYLKQELKRARIR